MSQTATRKTTRIGLGLIVVIGLVFAMAVPAFANHVVPTPISSGNPTCDDFAPEGETWTEFKLEGGDLADGTYTDGTLTVTISNFVNSSSGTPGSFDWESNIGVDAVFVKAGNDKHNLYVYSPEETEDTGLGPQAGQGNGISHISFCYDDGEEPTPTPTPEVTPTPTPEVTPTPTPEATPTPTPEATPTPTPEATPTPTPEATPTPTPAPTGTPAGTATPAATPTPTPTEGVLGGTPAPTAAPVPNTAMGSWSQLPASALSLLLLASLGAMAYARVAYGPTKRR